MKQRILDPCCGSKMMWFDKNRGDVIFCDERNEPLALSDRVLNIAPDVVIDFCAMPFDDNTFRVVAFDPPHLIRAGKNSWLAKKYGVLKKSWRDDIKKGVSECMRVLKPGGVLIFKWNETQVKLSEVLSAIDYKPLFGHTSGRQNKTIWMTFIKDEAPEFPELLADMIKNQRPMDAKTREIINANYLELMAK